MRFTLLGTGTSAGVPAIGCTCAVCTSSDPRDNRLRSGAMLRFTDAQGRPRVILVDATPDLRQQALRYGIERCDAILFTHNHVDHTFGLDEVRRYNAMQKSPIDVYAEEHTLSFLRGVYRHVFERAANVNDSFVAEIVPWRITPGEPLNLWGVRVTPIRLLHGRLPIVGFRFEGEGGTSKRAVAIDDQNDQDGDRVENPTPCLPSAQSMPSAPLEFRRSCDPLPNAQSPPGRGEVCPFPLAYCTDVSAIPPESWRYLRGLGTLVIDALRHRTHPTHFTVAQALGVVERVEPGVAYFTHISHELGHAETEATLPEGVRMGFDGLTIGGYEG